MRYRAATEPARSEKAEGSGFTRPSIHPSALRARVRGNEGEADGVVASSKQAFVCSRAQSQRPRLIYSPLPASCEASTSGFTTLTGLSPTTGLCIVVSYSMGGSTAITQQYESALLNIVSGCYWSQSSNAGSTWNVGLGTNTARFYVYGTY